MLNHDTSQLADVDQLSQFSKELAVIGGKDCAAVTRTPAHDETFKIGKGISVKSLHTPCHTQDSICWLMEDGDDRAVFTGDTLFIGGDTSAFFLETALTAQFQVVEGFSRAPQIKCIQL